MRLTPFAYPAKRNLIIPHNCKAQLSIAVSMSNVMGRKRKVSGSTVPSDCEKPIPKRTANPPIMLLPRIQPVKSGFSSADGKK